MRTIFRPRKLNRLKHSGWHISKLKKRLHDNEQATKNISKSPSIRQDHSALSYPTNFVLDPRSQFSLDTTSIAGAKPSLCTQSSTDPVRQALGNWCPKPGSAGSQMRRSSRRASETAPNSEPLRFRLFCSPLRHVGSVTSPETRGSHNTQRLAVCATIIQRTPG